MLTLLELLNRTTDYFTKHAVESPRLTAELLLADALGKTRMQLYTDFEQGMVESVLAGLRPSVKRIGEGEPLDYVLGYREFDGHRFAVNPDVLIPRPETELLLEAVAPLVDAASALPIVDVGTGSGALAVSLARRFPQVSVVGLDLSDKALAVARQNGEGVPNVTWRQSDLLDAWEGEAQLIVANLPYIPTAVLPTLPSNVRREPMTALDGGADGLDLIRRLIDQSRGRTRVLALEHFEGQAPVIESLCQQADYPLLRRVPDLRGDDRIVLAQRHG